MVQLHASGPPTGPITTPLDPPGTNRRKNRLSRRYMQLTQAKRRFVHAPPAAQRPGPAPTPDALAVAPRASPWSRTAVLLRCHRLFLPTVDRSPAWRPGFRLLHCDGRAGTGRCGALATVSKRVEARRRSVTVTRSSTSAAENQLRPRCFPVSVRMPAAVSSRRALAADLSLMSYSCWAVAMVSTGVPGRPARIRASAESARSVRLRSAAARCAASLS